MRDSITSVSIIDRLRVSIKSKVWPKAGVGNVDPGGPVSLQSLAPTLIKHT